MEALCKGGAPNVVTLSDDFARGSRKSCFWVTRSGQQPELFTALNGLGTARGSELVEGAGAVGLPRILGDEELGGDLAVAEPGGDEFKDPELGGVVAGVLRRGGVGRNRR